MGDPKFRRLANYAAIADGIFTVFYVLYLLWTLSCSEKYYFPEGQHALTRSEVSKFIYNLVRGSPYNFATLLWAVFGAQLLDCAFHLVASFYLYKTSAAEVRVNYSRAEGVPPEEASAKAKLWLGVCVVFTILRVVYVCLVYWRIGCSLHLYLSFAVRAILIAVVGGYLFEMWNARRVADNKVQFRKNEEEMDDSD